MAEKKSSYIKKKSKKEKRNIPKGIVHVKATFNNTVITVSDPNGNVLSWSSSGSLGFKGAKKSTPFAAQITAERAVTKAISDYGLKQVDVKVKGPGTGREAAIRALSGAGLIVKSIRDVTPIPHNGCRPRKRRRV